MDVTDICKKTHRMTDKSNRTTNSLDPSYTINGMNIQDDLKYTKPKIYPAYIADNNQLRTDDIPGAHPGWRPPSLLNPPIEKRREFRNTNFIGDIEGAHPDTIKHSITTSRTTNPLNPIYQGLDPGVQLTGPAAPLIPADVYRVPTILAKSSTSTSIPIRNKSLDNTINLPGSYTKPTTHSSSDFNAGNSDMISFTDKISNNNNDISNNQYDNPESFSKVNYFHIQKYFIFYLFIYLFLIINLIMPIEC